ncbi:UNVERIFIED_CONTAM: hypothetical protein Sindi_1548400 [Sesamum indicum]
MAERHGDRDSDDTAPAAAECRPVFVDTSLDSHLAVILSNSDTVSDFKKKIMREHVCCFPKMGEIEIHSLKVYVAFWRGNFYRLPDLMLVWNVFHGVKGNWFLSIDASGVPQHYLEQKSYKPGTSNDVMMETRSIAEDHCRDLVSDANVISTFQMPSPDGGTGQNATSELNSGLKLEKCSEKNTDFPNKSMENYGETKPPTKKKSKTRHNQDKLGTTLVEGTSLGGEAKRNTSESTEKSEILPLKSELPENVIAVKPKNTLAQNVLTKNLKGVTLDTSAQGKKRKRKARKEEMPQNRAADPGLSPPEYDERNRSFLSKTTDFHADVPSEPSQVPQRKQCISLPLEGTIGTTAFPLKGTDIHELDNDMNMKVDILTQFSQSKVKGEASSLKNKLPVISGTEKETNMPDIEEEPRESSLNHDPVRKLSENLRTSDQREADINIRESVQLNDFLVTKGEVEHSNRRKTKANKSGGKFCNGNDEEHANNAMQLNPTAVLNFERNTRKDHETERVDSIFSTAETDLNVRSKEDRDLSLNHQSDMKLYEVNNTIKEPNSSAVLMDANDIMGDAKSNSNKRKKKGTQKTTAKIQDMSDKEHETKMRESIGPYKITGKAKGIEEERELYPNHDTEVMLDPNADPEPKIFNGSRRKKRGIKKSADKNLHRSDKEETSNSMSSPSILLCPSTNNFSHKTHQGENIFHEGKDNQMILLDGSTVAYGKSIQDASGNHADILESTQTGGSLQTLKDMDSRKGKMETENQSSAGNCHTDLLAGEKENPIESLKPHQAEQSIKNIGIEVKKKRKKRQPAGSDVQENLPTKDKKVGGDELATEEKSNNFITSEQQDRHVVLSQVPSHREGEKLDEMHETADKNENNNVKKATKANEEMKSEKETKKNGVPSVRNSTELRNSLKPYENQDNENESCVRCDSGRKDGRSAVNSNQNEPRSFEVSDNEVKDSSPSAMRGMKAPEKHDGVPAASCCQKEKNVSLAQSVAKRSETFPENKGSKRWQQDQNVINRIAVRTPQKESLFTKSGAIFQDNSVENSADDSDAATHSSSDSSSLSGYSTGESDLSQYSDTYGSNNAKERHMGGESLSKLDSKRFKKAKLIASQYEQEQMEFVPDGQLTQ